MYEGTEEDAGDDEDAGDAPGRGVPSNGQVALWRKISDLHFGHFTISPHAPGPRESRTEGINLSLTAATSGPRRRSKSHHAESTAGSSRHSEIIEVEAPDARIIALLHNRLIRWAGL